MPVVGPDTERSARRGVGAVRFALLATLAAWPLVACGRPGPAFTDSFSPGSLDGTRWETCYPWAAGSGCTNEGNRELEWYLPGQVSVSGGALHLTARRDPVLGAVHRGASRWFPYRSGMVTTAGHFDFTYGLVEFEARAPAGRGLWPALWLLPSDRSWPPEVDIMEAFGDLTDQVTVTYHRTPSVALRTAVPVSDLTERWHSYALDWRPDSLTWYVDHRPVFAVQGDVPHKPMYLLATLAVSGDAQHAPDRTTPASASFDIAQVRVWQY